jgi:hypothetical protein
MEQYCNQFNQDGILALLAKRPPNSIIGMMKTGARPVAVVSFSKADERR